MRVPRAGKGGYGGWSRETEESGGLNLFDQAVNQVLKKYLDNPRLIGKNQRAFLRIDLRPNPYNQHNGEIKFPAIYMEEPIKVQEIMESLGQHGITGSQADNSGLPRLELIDVRRYRNDIEFGKELFGKSTRIPTLDRLVGLTSVVDAIDMVFNDHNSVIGQLNITESGLNQGL